ncbi:hypothetical protein U1Q18_035374, partial [Sarracenia purpurea var. burkii]
CCWEGVLRGSNPAQEQEVEYFVSAMPLSAAIPTAAAGLVKTRCVWNKKLRADIYANQRVINSRVIKQTLG